jgi:di/tricarboxylate transporter
VSPVGYQTNLMVYGPGGYRFSDYVKLGLPLTIIIAIVTAAVAPLFFPFR